MNIDLKNDYNLTKNDLHIIENLVKNVSSDNLVDVKVFFNYLLDFYTSKQLISMFKVGVSTYYEFYSNHKVNTLKQNRFYKKMRDLFLHIHLGGLENEN